MHITTNSSFPAPIPSTFCNNMPQTSLATLLIVTCFLSTVNNFHHMVAGNVLSNDDLFPLDVRTDHDAITMASSDFGHIVEAIPHGVFHPTSAADIAALISSHSRSRNHSRWRRAGEATQARGQALAPGGVVIDMQSMGRGDRGHRVNVASSGLTLAASSMWIDVLRATLEHGLAPRVWTDYLRITVGGTLSNGGIGGQAYGGTVTCSPAKNSDLFFAALGGLGQFGVITRARIALEPAPKRVRWVRLAYTDVGTFTSDQELLISKRDGESGFDYVEGQVQLNRTLTEGRRSSSFFSPSELDRLANLAVETRSGAIYYIEAAMYYDDDDTVAVVDQKLETLLDGLRFVPGHAFVRDVSYVEFLDRVGREEQKLRSAGAWDVPHPWLNLFVPGSRILDFDAGVFKGVLRDAKPVGLILMYPMNKDRWDGRMTTATPEEDVFYAVGLLRSAVAAGDLERLERENQAVLEFCDRERIGCKQYLPHHAAQDGWKRHFGEKWGRVAALKRKYDPRAILSPGQGIFSAIIAVAGEAGNDSL
ncbi:hypothetical protein EJB05_41328, partial [Eragrostis curvula]